MRKPGLPVLVLVLAVASVLALFVWSQYSARVEAERKLGLDASRIVSEQFSRRGDVRVASLSGTVVARGEDEGILGLVPSEQVTRLPFTVDYFVDLSGIGARAYRWDADSRTLTIDVPDVAVAKPNIDEAASESNQKGLYISRRASLELARQTSERAAARSRKAAERPENMNKARASARETIARMARGSLTAVGMDDVQVAVRFPWEPQPSDSERWDQSRRIEDVLNGS